MNKQHLSLSLYIYIYTHNNTYSNHNTNTTNTHINVIDNNMQVIHQLHNIKFYFRATGSPRPTKGSAGAQSRKRREGRTTCFGFVFDQIACVCQNQSKAINNNKQHNTIIYINRRGNKWEGNRGKDGSVTPPAAFLAQGMRRYFLVTQCVV